MGFVVDLVVIGSTTSGVRVAPKSLLQQSGEGHSYLATIDFIRYRYVNFSCTAL